jgi:uncharacterized cupredoxin-like copper-binding protein
VRFSRQFAPALALGLGALALVVVACGNETVRLGSVDVSLEEFAVSTSESSTFPATTTFDVTNQGPNETHEFVIIKTDLGPTQLPTDDTGAVDENGAGIDVIGEIEDIPVGESESLEVDLEAGNYVFICNIYDQSTQMSHYQEGMRTGFTVQ